MRTIKYCVTVGAFCSILVGIVVIMNSLSEEETLGLEKSLYVASIESVKDTTTEVEGWEKKHVWHTIYQLVEEEMPQQITLIDMLPNRLEKDRYDRYFALFQAVGINQAEEIDVYDYYMVLQPDESGQLYTMPLGIQIIKTDLNMTKRALAANMVKVANGWNITQSEFEKQWNSKIIIEDQVGVEVDGANTMTHIYHAQQIFTFITDYIQSCMDLIGTDHFEILDAYYQDVSELKATHIALLKELAKESIKIELLGVELINVICNEAEALYEVTVEGRLRIYEEERIHCLNEQITYILKQQDNRLVITEDKNL